jgi:hypothetical protein
MPQQQNAQGYRLQFAVVGFGTLSGRTLRVRVVRPDSTSFDRTSAGGDVAVLDAALNLIGVRIITGDLTKIGKYKYQAFDETGGIFLPTNVKEFYVDQNLAAS